MTEAKDCRRVFPTGQARGEIHLGDLACALATLPWQDAAQAARIAACLGFGLRPHSPVAPGPASHRVYDRRSTAVSSPPEPAPSREPPISLPPTPPRPVPLPDGVLRSRLTRLPTRAPPRDEPPDWLAAGTEAFPAEALPRLARATLLPERTARHVLSAALAAPRRGGEIDLARLIDAVCRREPLRELPRCRETTLDRGCQLLLDYSGSMVPFWEDLHALTEQVADVVGRQATRVYRFDGRPTEARRWTPAGEPEPWSPDGRPVLVATDLGIQGLAVAEPSRDWDELSARCAQAGSPLLLLIPWPADRWPQAFPAHATLVHWGPRTTAGMVRRRTASLMER